MKIICIGRNYLKHARELEHDIPTEPVFFMKPDSSLLLDNKHFYLPGFSNEIHHEVELVIKINRLGKSIEARYAHRYYDEIGLGVDFTARDLQRQLIEKGLPGRSRKPLIQQQYWAVLSLKKNSEILGRLIFRCLKMGY
jgi:acylpyruvate hydrolase